MLNVRVMKMVLSLLFLMFAAASGAFAEQIDIDKLVSQLAAGDFKAREAAAQELREIGMPTRDALEKAAKANDPELKMRAKQILREILSGIPYSWPEPLRVKLLSFKTLDDSGRTAVVDELVRDYGEAAYPFLFTELGKDDAAVSDAAYRGINSIPNKEKNWAIALDKIEDPNGNELRLLIEAAAGSGKPDGIIRVLSLSGLTPEQRAPLVMQAVKAVRVQLEAGANGEAEKLARTFVKVEKDNAQLVYCLAIALARSGPGKESAELMEKALLMSKDEGARYSAGELLLDSGYLRQSEKEWLQILEMPPADSVYDINAYMRLGSIYARARMFTRAADMLEKGKAKYAAAKADAGSGMGMIGGDTLDKSIEEYRRRANADEPDEVPDTLEDPLFSMSLKAFLKSGDGEELVKDERDAAVKLTVNVEPHGFRLFEKSNAALAYDRAAGELSVLLNNAPCTKSQAFVMKEKTATVVVRNLDMLYIFLVERETGVVSRLRSYEFDYKAVFVPDKAVLEWKDVSFKLNDTSYSWKELAEGVSFDWLPQKLDVVLEGVAPSGKEMKIRQTMDVGEN